jgi:hypothetical protein
LTTIAVRQPAGVGVLGLGRALVLRGAADGERELALRAEALRAHLVGRRAGRDREQALVEELLRRGRAVLDVAGVDRDLGALLDELRGAGLLPLELVVADLDLEVRAAALASFAASICAPCERRRVERLHAARQVDRRRRSRSSGPAELLPEAVVPPP